MTAPEGPVWREEPWVGAVLGAPVDVRLVPGAPAEPEGDAEEAAAHAAELRAALPSVLLVGVWDVRPFGVELPP